MATNLAAQAPTTHSEARPLGQLLPGAAGLLYAGVQLEGGITAAVYRGISTVPDDRLSFPFSGSLATATSLTWGLTQALFVVTLLGFSRSGAVGASRPTRPHRHLARAGGRHRVPRCARGERDLPRCPRGRPGRPGRDHPFRDRDRADSHWVHRCRRGRRPRGPVDGLAALPGPRGRCVDALHAAAAVHLPCWRSRSPSTPRRSPPSRSPSSPSPNVARNERPFPATSLADPMVE
jgi:hypothetical protein